MWIGYFDESGKQDDLESKCLTLGGYLGSPDAWAQLNSAWRAVLDQFGVPYSHMRELQKEKGAFSHLNQNRKIEFLKALAGVVAACGLRGYGALVRLPDLVRFNNENGLNVDAYALAVYSMLLDFSEGLPGTQIDVHMDHFGGCHTKLTEAGRLMLTDRYYPERAVNFREHIRLEALSNKQTFRELLPLQAADFAAWELRREHVGNNEWFETVKPTIDAEPKDWFPSLLQYQLRRDKKVVFPFNRRISLRALSDAARFEGIMWDYRALNTAHVGREGRW